MALEYLKSAYLTNATASPKVPTNPVVAKGRVYEAVAYVAAAADATAASTYHMARVPSNARVTALLLTAADFTTAGAINIGLYRTAEDGGAVVDQDFFVSALAMTGGPFAESDQKLESGVNTIANSESPIWAVLGLTEDPCVIYDIVIVITTTFNGGAPMQLKVRWVE